MLKKLLLATFVAAFFFTLIAPSPAYAWLSGWTYRKAITVNNTANANALTDYQIILNITYSSNMQKDMSDLRFTYYNSTADNETEIPYWIILDWVYNATTQTINTTASKWKADYILTVPNTATGCGILYISSKATTISASGLPLNVSINGTFVGTFTIPSSDPNLVKSLTVCNVPTGTVNVSIWTSNSLNAVDIYYVKLEYYNLTQRVMIKVPYIGAGKTETVYMYYGNTTPVTSKSDENSVVLFGDEDFSAGWTIEGSNTLAIRSAGVKARMFKFLQGGFITDGDEDTATLSLSLSGYDFRFHVWLRTYRWNAGTGTNCRNWWSVTVTDGVSTWNLIYYTTLGVTYTDSAPNYYFLVGDYSSVYSANTNTVEYTKIFRSIREDLKSKGITPGNNLKITKLTYSHYKYAPGTGAETDTDFLFIVKYTSPEPTASVGAEETPNQPPTISISSPLNQTYFTTSITAKFTATDDKSATFVIKVYLDNSLIYENSSYANNTEISLTLANLQDGTHNFTVFADDLNGATAAQSVVFTIVTVPKYSEIVVSPPSPQIYGVSKIWFNITWQDDNNNLDKVWIEHNFSGTTKAYLMLNDTPTHFYYLLDFKPAAGTYAYTFYANDTAGNKNNTQTFSYTINKADSQLTLAANPGWQITAGESVTISCSAVQPLTVTLYKDGVVVANPYTFAPGFGIYNFTCVISDSQNYTPAATFSLLNVLGAGFGCASPNDYIWQANISTNGASEIVLNFTDLVSKNMVKKDLSDVNVSVPAWINTTKGYYLILNATGQSNVVVKFGNYIANNSYAQKSYTASPQTFGYQEIATSWYHFNLLDEFSGAKLLPPGANTTFTLFCSAGANTFLLNDSEFYIPTVQKIDEVRATVQYSVTEIYYRSKKIDYAISTENIFLIDANKKQVVEIMFKLDNRAGLQQPILRVKKWMADRLNLITEQSFDAENKAITYLGNGEKYSIYVKDPVQSVEYSIGYLYVDPSDVVKTIILGQIQTVNQAVGNISLWLTRDNSTGTICFNYEDPSGLTEFVEFWVYNSTDQQNPTLLYYANSSEQKVSMCYVPPEGWNQTYFTAKYHVKHKVWGENSIAGSMLFAPLFMFPVPPISFLPYLALGLVITTQLLFGSVYAEFGIIVSIAIAVLLAYLGWWAPSILLLAIAFLFAIFSLIKRGDYESV